MNDPILALDLHAGKDRHGQVRRVVVLLDAQANPVEVLDHKRFVRSSHAKLPRFGPIDVRSGVYREMMELKRSGMPKVFRRRSGRQVRQKPLTLTLGERSSNLEDVKTRLLEGRRR